MQMTSVALALVLKLCQNLLISVMITRMLMKSPLMLRRLLVLFFLLKKLKCIRPFLFFCRALKENFHKVRYLGILIKLNQYLLDDDDIKRQVRMLNSAANKLRSSFVKCSSTLKNT